MCACVRGTETWLHSLAKATSKNRSRMLAYYRFPPQCTLLVSANVSAQYRSGPVDRCPVRPVHVRADSNHRCFCLVSSIKAQPLSLSLSLFFSLSPALVPQAGASKALLWENTALNADAVSVRKYALNLLTAHMWYPLSHTHSPPPVTLLFLAFFGTYVIGESVQHMVNYATSK